MLLPREATAQDEPSMPEAPHEYKLSGWAGVQSWSTDGDAPERIDDHAVYGLEVERIVASFLSVRFGAGYGSATAANDQGTLDIASYVFDFDLRGRLALGPLGPGGLTPVVLVSAGAVVHDPDGGELRTRSQTALGAGVALEYDLTSRIGLQAEWRHHWINLENAFDPTARESARVTADRFTGSFYWRF